MQVKAIPTTHAYVVLEDLYKLPQTVLLQAAYKTLINTASVRHLISEKLANKQTNESYDLCITLPELIETLKQTYLYRQYL